MKLRTMNLIDGAFSWFQSRIKWNRPGLRILLFHHVFKDKKEIHKNEVYPQEALTINDYKFIINTLRNNGHRFVSGDEVLSGLPPEDKCVMLTFDDGYANNARLLPLLEAMKVPVTWFISTDFIANNRPFWWDILWRHSLEWDKKKIFNFKESLIPLPRKEIEAKITETFGLASLNTNGDLDRPLTINELLKYSSNPYVTIGSHTCDHIDLSNTNKVSIIDQLQRSSVDLKKWIGKEPLIISYPFGRWNYLVEKNAKKVGYKLGITTIPISTKLPFKLTNKCAFRLGRYQIKGDLPSLDSQIRKFESSFSFEGWYAKHKKMNEKINEYSSSD
tara:strand:+ start:407 stop:1402 length:996 start_codon:yes stop_codon:yes gene_type:complete